MNTNPVGNIIKKLIDDNNLNQTSFGKSLNVSQGMVGQWIRDERPVSVDMALEIEQLYGIDAGTINEDVKKSRQKIRA